MVESLDDKDDFGIHNSYVDSVVNQARYWLFEWKPQWTFLKRSRHTELKAYIMYFAPCIDYELAQLGVIPYSCSRPCKTHAR